MNETVYGISDISVYTPMMQHYLSVKTEYRDCILFYRLGDFYEMFFDDAKVVSKELELTLTGKSCGTEERAPMCGIPFHAADTYINRLVKRGYKVAICEQLEDPKTATGIVKRGVIRVVTPGTNLDNYSLDESMNNYLMSVCVVEDVFGISLCDISTGELMLTEVKGISGFYDQYNKSQPSEIICNDAFVLSGVDVDVIKNKDNTAVSVLNSGYFDDSEALRLISDKFPNEVISGTDINEFPTGILSCGAILKYLFETQKNDLINISSIKIVHDSTFMELDSATRRNLELTETLRDKEKRGSLLWVLDHTKTAMGARFLRQMIEEPLKSKQEIEKRLDCVDEFLKHVVDREELREYLNPVYDLERLVTRVSYKTANPRDLVSLRGSLNSLPPIKQVLSGFDSKLINEINNDIDSLSDICSILINSINDEPPVSVHDGNIIKTGFDATVDELRLAQTNGKTWIAELESGEKEETGIKNLRVRYNKVFGYYIEITNSNLDQVPDRYIRKQTLTNAERFFTPELKEMENKILGAEDRLYSLENSIYNQILDKITENVQRIQKTARSIAKIDALISLSVAAERGSFKRPKINERGKLVIKKGRHPVVEKMMKDSLFVDNDTELDTKDNRVAIITGPNMAGKSTYMRQVALITLMAQIGSFVPAESADISIVDRIFTRVGASDDLSSGQSTFMVEMNEVANILKNATKNSLLILDEIGRGTSTFDGLSIAWAVVEYVSDPKIIGAKTLFATHYHELTELEGKLSGVHNYCSAVKENPDGIVFLRKIVRGGADRSYGIEVAKIAGLPKEVIDRAEDLLQEILKNDLSTVTQSIEAVGDVMKASEKKKAAQSNNDDSNQLSFLGALSDNDIIDEIIHMDLSAMTPIEAMNELDSIQKKVKNRW